MDFTGIASVTAITVICWLIGEVFSNLPIENKWIPSIVGGFGMLLGVVGWLVMPEFPADNILTAFAVGIVSGLASTGADQIWKQIHPSDKGRIVFPCNEGSEQNETERGDLLISATGETEDGFFRSIRSVEMTEEEDAGRIYSNMTEYDEEDGADA